MLKIRQEIAAVLVPLVFLTACGNPDQDTGGRDIAAAVQVIVEPLRLDNTSTRLEAVGTSRAVRSIEIFPATSGEVVSINFQPGHFVESGDILVELERREEELALSLAEVQLEDAERLFDRYQRSAGSGAVLPTTFDAARTAVESARIAVERARVALDYRTIRAPFAGYVGLTDVDSGDRITTTTPITSLDDRSALLVSFEVPEALNSEISVGNPVEVSSWNNREPAGSGIVADIGSRINPATRTFVVRAKVDNSKDQLRPGMSFRVAMDVTGTPYPVVAETAVQWGADGAYVWTVQDGRAERVPVSIVQRSKGHVLIDTQLDPETLIVIEGIQRLRTGVDVTYDTPAHASGDGKTKEKPAAAPADSEL
jgi:RND family efflux transporter MFP subunit